MSNEFSVYWWDAQGNQITEHQFVDAQKAINTVKRLTQLPSSLVVERVIITDGDDCIAFEWSKDKGITFQEPIFLHH